MPHIIETKLREIDAEHKEQIIGSCEQKAASCPQRRCCHICFSLYEGERHFTDREDVRQHLPDILGKALARTWIDNEFHKLDHDPVGTLESHGIFIPSTMSIEFNEKHLTAAHCCLSKPKFEI